MKTRKVWRVSELMPDGTWNEWDIDYDTRRQAKLAVRAMGKDPTKTAISKYLTTAMEMILYSCIYIPRDENDRKACRDNFTPDKMPKICKKSRCNFLRALSIIVQEDNSLKVMDKELW